MDDIQVTRHPMEWSFARFVASLRSQTAVAPPRPAMEVALLVPRRIGVADLGSALAAGFRDFRDCRTDVAFLCVIYPLIGLLLGRLAFGAGLIHLAFPLVSGFALVGPVFAAGLYEMSRQRETRDRVTWATSFDAFRSPAIGSIVRLGLVLLALFLAWMGTADFIYIITLGAALPPYTVLGTADFVRYALSTGPGLAMIVAGIAAGAVFAAVVLAISVVSFPLLLDRNIPVAGAVVVSVRAVRENPRTLALWGLIVAGGLVLGSVPFLLGLSIVLPVLGHATWHLYRRMFP